MPEQVANRSSGQQTLSIQDALDLAVVHHTAGDLAKAESVYRKILETDPDHPAALQLLGVIAHQMGRNDAAVDLISRAIARDPDYAEAHNNLGLALHDLGKLDQAVASYHQALAIKSDYAEANNNLGLALQALGKVEDALASYLQALATEPDYAGAHYNFGNALRELGRLDEAIASYQKALAIRPGFAEAHYHLGETLRELGRLEEAVASYREALSIKPDFAEVLNNLGNALRELGRLDDALASYRKALDFKPDFSGAGRNLLYALLNVSGLSQEELFNEHLRFSETHLRGIARPVEDLTNDPTSHRRLRVGYLSSDFHNHPVGSNVLPLLSSHDRKKFEIFCYAQVRRPDAMTQRFRSCVDHWRAIAGKSDSEVAGMVRADGIDILVCLAGHAGDNRLLVCAYRAAPVQVSFHDLASSALAEMDYWLTDAFLHPPGTKERFTEELQPLQVFYQYPPVLEAPPVDRLPADQAGFVTFGSFNNPAKVNEDVTGLWAKVLKSVPGSRLLFKYLNWYAQESLRDRMVDEFAAQEIGTERLIFAAALDTLAEHLDHYTKVDIALDPFPFNGATTTFQALWMGVPVVTLAGESFISRAAGSILHHAGLGELAVDTPEQYVECARDLAGDLGRLKTVRASLRDQVAASPLCDAPAYARDVENAYRDMWRKWCARTNTKG